MPKINVYLPDELAAAVRQAGVPVSPVCQQALTEAVAKVTRARRAVEAIRDPALSDPAAERLTDAVAARLTARCATVLELARRGAAEAGQPVGSARLLLGLLDEGANLALSILESLEVDLDDLRLAAGRQLAQAEELAPETAGEAAGEPAEHDAEPAGEVSLRLNELTMHARRAIAGAIESSIGFGHNYVGCEHLLLGLLEDPASQAGQALTGLTVTPASVRRAMTSALAGFAHGRRWAGASSPAQDLAGRIEALERRLAAMGG